MTIFWGCGILLLNNKGGRYGLCIKKDNWENAVINNYKYFTSGKSGKKTYWTKTMVYDVEDGESNPYIVRYAGFTPPNELYYVYYHPKTREYVVLDSKTGIRSLTTFSSLREIELFDTYINLIFVMSRSLRKNKIMAKYYTAIKLFGENEARKQPNKKSDNQKTGGVA